MPIISGNIHVKRGAPVPQELLDALASPVSVISGNVIIEPGAIMPGQKQPVYVWDRPAPTSPTPLTLPAPLTTWLTLAAAVLGIIAALIWMGK